MKTVNVTPKWEDVIMLYVEACARGKRAAREELVRCAKLADMAVAAAARKRRKKRR